MNLSWQHDMKASPNSTVHYRNSIRTIFRRTDDVTICYICNVFTGYRIKRGYEKRSPYHVLNHILPTWSTNRWYIGSISSKPLLEKQRSVCITDGKANLPQLAEDPYLLTFLSQRWGTDNTNRSLGLVVLESMFWQKVVLQVRAELYTYTATWLLPSKPLGLYDLSTNLNKSNALCKFFC
jgi:hypothetical protein